MSKMLTNYEARQQFYGLMFLFSFIFFGGFGLIRIIKNVQFNQNCGGHLELAAHANTVELAKSQLEIAVKYMQDNKMIEGYTSVVYKTPDEDVGFWYTNMNNSLNELNEVKKDASSLEKSNILIKLRESIMSSGEHGDNIMLPEGISIFPNNVVFSLWGYMSSLFLFISICGCIVYKD